MEENIKIICVETSGKSLSIALSENGKSILEYRLNKFNSHDKFAAEFIRRILNDLSLSISDIDAIAISSGPGSFTGLRIGSSLVKGLTFDNKPKLIAVPTLSYLADSLVDINRLLNKDSIITSVASHQNVLYYQEFDKNGNPISEIIMDSSENFEALDLTNKLVCGISNELSNVPDEFKSLSADKMIRLAVKMYNEGSFTLSEDFTPLYVQEFIPKKSNKKLNF